MRIFWLLSLDSFSFFNPVPWFAVCGMAVFPFFQELLPWQNRGACNNELGLSPRGGERVYFPRELNEIGSGEPCDEVNYSHICPFIRIIPKPGWEVAVFSFFLFIKLGTERPVTEPSPLVLSSDYDSKSFDFELESSQICRLSCSRRALCSRSDIVPVWEAIGFKPNKVPFLLSCLLIQTNNTTVF